jgi:hypothetical protein
MIAIPEPNRFGMPPAFILDHVQGADLQHVEAQKLQGVSTFVLKDVKILARLTVDLFL